MPPKINNLVELNQYLEQLENRIGYLEKGVELQARIINELQTNPPPKGNNKDVIDYMRREKRIKIIGRISLAIIGCVATFAAIAYLFSNLPPIKSIP